jgi:exonuclease III
MMLRLATWNMDHWRRSDDLRQKAWDFLERAVHPDVALVQEAVPAGRGCSVVFREGGILDDRSNPRRDLGWGSAVISYGPFLRPLVSAKGPFRPDDQPLLRTFPGSVAIAEVVRDVPIVVVSAYGLIDRGYAETTVHRILSDLTPLIDERRGHGIIIAGDLNVTTQWSEKHRSFLKGRHDECLRRDRNLFDRFAALGLHNVVVRSGQGPLEGCGCDAGEECQHVQTQRHDLSDFPWQNDYIFVSEDLLRMAPIVEVFDQEEVWQLSGHCPVAVGFASL